MQQPALDVESLRVQIDGGTRRPLEDSRREPIGERFRRGAIAIGLAAEFQPHDVVRDCARRADSGARRRSDRTAARRRRAGSPATLAIVHQRAKRLDPFAEPAHFKRSRAAPSDLRSKSRPLASFCTRFALHRDHGARRRRRQCSTFKEYFNFFAKTRARLLERRWRAASRSRFALVAVIGRPRPALRARAIGCGETRTPTPPSGPISSVGNLVARRQHDRQRSRPERVGEPPRDRAVLRARPQMPSRVGRDQRDRLVRARVPLSANSRRSGDRRKRVGADRVERFGRIDDQLAGAQRRDRIMSLASSTDALATISDFPRASERRARCRGASDVPRTRSFAAAS